MKEELHELTPIMQQIYLQADELAKGLKQRGGEKNDYCITLEQLMMILDKFINK
jgi:hypothetical protein